MPGARGSAPEPPARPLVRFPPLSGLPTGGLPAAWASDSAARQALYEAYTMAELSLVAAPHIRPDGTKHPNAFDARLNEVVLCTSETPLLSAARALLASGQAQPDDTIVMRHAGSGAIALRAIRRPHLADRRHHRHEHGSFLGRQGRPTSPRSLAPGKQMLRRDVVPIRQIRGAQASWRGQSITEKRAPFGAISASPSRPTVTPGCGERTLSATSGNHSRKLADRHVRIRGLCGLDLDHRLTTCGRLIPTALTKAYACTCKGARSLGVIGYLRQAL